MCARVGAVGDVMEADGPFDVLVAGPALGTRSGLARLEVIHDDQPAMSVLLAFSRRPDASLRDIVRTGAVDMLQLPASDEAVLASLERAIQLGQAREPAVAPVAAPLAAEAPKPATVLTTASATGGCGKTFYATNLASFLAHHTKKKVCIVDLDLQFGEVSTALRLRPRFTIFDALQRDDTDEADLRAHIDEYLVQHETGVWVMPAPKDPSEADRISPPDVTRVVEALRNRFDYVIVDTPAALTEVVLAAFDLSDLLFCMATLDLPSVRNMGVFLNTLEKLKIPTENIRLILNKAETDVGIDVEQITKLFPQGFSSVLPYAKEVSRSINLGMPVITSSPGSEVSRRLAEGMMELLPEAERQHAQEAVPASGGRLGRLFKRFEATAH